MKIETLATPEQIRLLQDGMPSQEWIAYAERITRQGGYTPSEVLAAFRAMALQNYQSSFADLGAFGVLPADTLAMLQHHVAYRDRRIPSIEMIGAVLEAIAIYHLMDTVTPDKPTSKPKRHVVRKSKAKPPSQPSTCKPVDPVFHADFESFLNEALMLTQHMESQIIEPVLVLFQQAGSLMENKAACMNSVTWGQMRRFAIFMNRVQPYMDILEKLASK